MPEPTDWEQLERYCAGELGEDDAVQLRRWLMAHPEHAQILDRVNRELDYTSLLGDLDRSDALVSWHALTGRMRDGTKTLATENTAPAKNRRGGDPRSSLSERTQFSGQHLRRWAWYSAGSLVIGVLGVVFGRYGQTKHPFGPGMSTYTTTNGERANIALPDGTAISLDVASRLDVPADYTAGNHTVRLNGQAMFTVVHHGGTPFTVMAGATAARVLGTSFVVRHYPTDTTTTVAVRDGKVAVRSLVLTAARQVEISPAGVAHLQPADPAQFSFAAGVLTLNGATLSAAIPELNRWYNVDIRLGDPRLATQQLAGEYVAGSIADVMDILAGTLPVRVVRTGRVLTLYPR